MTSILVDDGNGNPQTVTLTVPGTAGTPSADVISIQGITSMTPIKTDGSGVTQPVSGTFWQTTQPVSIAGTVAISAASLPLPTGAAQDSTVAGLQVAQASTTSGQSGHLAQGAVTTSAPSYTTGKTNPLSLTTAGALRTDASATTQPISAASLPLPSGAATSAKQPALGTAGTPSSDVLSVQGASGMTALKVDGSAVTQPVSGTVSVNALPAGTNTIGNVGIVSISSGGASKYRNINLGATGQLIKGSAGKITGYYIYNNSAATRYIKLYDKATAPTVGTDTPSDTWPLPAGSAANVSNVNGIAFANGIGIAATVNVADSDTTAPSANDVVVNVYYS